MSDTVKSAWIIGGCALVAAVVVVVGVWWAVHRASGRVQIALDRAAGEVTRAVAAASESHAGAITTGARRLEEEVARAAGRVSGPIEAAFEKPLQVQGAATVVVSKPVEIADPVTIRGAGEDSAALQVDAHVNMLGDE